MITILHEDNCHQLLRGSYQNAAVLQQLYEAEKMTVRRPVFPTRAEQ